MELKEIRRGEGDDWQIIGKDGKVLFADPDRQAVKRKWQELLTQPAPKEKADGAK